MAYAGGGGGWFRKGMAGGKAMPPMVIDLTERPRAPFLNAGQRAAAVRALLPAVPISLVRRPSDPIVITLPPSPPRQRDEKAVQPTRKKQTQQPALPRGLEA